MIFLLDLRRLNPTVYTFMPFRRLFALTCFALLLSLLRAETAFQFVHLNTQTGLSSNGVNDILRDEQGWVYIATNHGIDIFDGDKIRRNISQQTHSNLLNNHIELLAQDKTGLIWGQALCRVICYDPRSNVFFDNIEQRLGAMSVPYNRENFHVEIDPEGNFWAYDKEGIYYYNFDLHLAKQFHIAGITHIAFDKDMVWIGCEGATLIKIDPLLGGQLSDESLKKQFGEKAVEASHLFIDSHHTLWVFDQPNNALFARFENQRGWQRITPDSTKHEGIDLRNIAETKDGVVYFANGRYGLYRCTYNPARPLFEPYPYNAPKGIISRVKVDSKNILYLAYEQQGLYYTVPVGNYFNILRPSTFFLEPTGKYPSCADDVTCMVEDHVGDLWIGTNGNGLYRYPHEGDTPQHFDFDGQDVVVCLAEDAEHQIWVGTYGTGLYIIDAERKQSQHYLAGDGGLASNNVWAFTLDSKQRMWVGHLNNGLQRYNQDFDNFTRSNLKQSIQSLTQGSDNFFWVASTYGIFQVKEDTGICEHGFGKQWGDETLDTQWIKAICPMPEGKLWIGTHAGIYLADLTANTVSHIEAKGLTSEVIQSAIVDQQGNIWMTTEREILRINAEDLTVETYGVYYGMPDTFFNMGSTICLQDGRILIGSNDGIVSFDPLTLKDNDQWLADAFPMQGMTLPSPDTTISLPHLTYLLLLFLTAALSGCVGYFIALKKYKNKN